LDSPGAPDSASATPIAHSPRPATFRAHGVTTADAQPCG
jgi:hypothetical protein